MKNLIISYIKKNYLICTGYTFGYIVVTFLATYIMKRNDRLMDTFSLINVLFIINVIGNVYNELNEVKKKKVREKLITVIISLEISFLIFYIFLNIVGLIFLAIVKEDDIFKVIDVPLRFYLVTLFSNIGGFLAALTLGAFISMISKSKLRLIILYLLSLTSMIVIGSFISRIFGMNLVGGKVASEYTYYTQFLLIPLSNVTVNEINITLIKILQMGAVNYIIFIIFANIINFFQYRKR